jgi:hypothetical protein
MKRFFALSDHTDNGYRVKEQVEHEMLLPG